MKTPVYLKSTLQPGEQILFLGKIHPAYLVGPVLWTVVIIAIIYKLVTGLQLATLSVGIWATLLLPITYLIQHVVIYETSESALTTHRVLTKAGLLRRSISEIGLAKIESSSIEQGIVGRLFGFGDLVVRGSGGHAVTATALSTVMEFRAAVQNATNPP
jgi:uncharacterized membrane protein YdbT with pleckstrin-like domain